MRAPKLIPDKDQRWKMLWRIPLGILAGLLLIALLLHAGLWWASDMPGTSWAGSPPPPTLAQQKSATQLQRDVTMLAKTIGPRCFAHDGTLEQTLVFLEASMKKAGYTTQREEYEMRGKTVANLVTEIPGTTHPDQIVVIGAHYDTVCETPGANDNGSGTAALLELARLLAHKPLARTLRLVFFVNEEPPWFQFEDMGSLVHARRSKARGDKITAMFALETMGHFTNQTHSQSYPHDFMKWYYPEEGNFLAFVGMTESRDLIQRSIGTFRQHASLPSEGLSAPAWLPGVDFSDHWSFAQVGYPAVMITDTAFMRSQHYHQPTDRVDTLDYPQLSLAVHGLLHTITKEASNQ